MPDRPCHRVTNKRPFLRQARYARCGAILSVEQAIIIISVHLSPLSYVFRLSAPLAFERRHHAGDQILGTCLARESCPVKRLDMCRVLLYHVASARLPCDRLRCRNTHRSDRSALSIPPWTAHMTNNGDKRPCSAAIPLTCVFTVHTLYSTATGHKSSHYTAARSLVCLGAVRDGL
jgi:hypothetical protein